MTLIEGPLKDCQAFMILRSQVLKTMKNKIWRFWRLGSKEMSQDSEDRDSEDFLNKPLDPSKDVTTSFIQKPLKIRR